MSDSQNSFCGVFASSFGPSPSSASTFLFAKNLPDINCIKHHLPIGSLDVQGPDIMGRSIFNMFGCF